MRIRMMVWVVACIMPAMAFADVQDTGPLHLSYSETEDVRVIHFDPTLNYLVPYAIPTFTNSFRWQQRVFGWEPWDRTNVLLKDFSDYGGASAGAHPVNTLRFDIAPLSLTFETYPAAERMYTLMNHELVHVATMDMYTEQDARWRRFFRGKVLTDGRNPETLLYSYLTVPRYIVPRWFLEGSATFVETWMSGGMGRAQGGYDEMVFRAMVRDDAHFYDPLGLVSRGTRVDFQVGVNAYLYGTRFMTWLAYEHSPEKLIDWLRRDEGSARHYATDFERVYGMPLEHAWQEWIAFERAFQRANLERVRQHPVTPYRPLSPRALGSVSRSFLDEDKGELYGAFLYPGVIGHVGALRLEDGSIRHLADLKGPMLYRVTSTAFDRDSGTLFYTTDNYAMRDIVAIDVDSGEQRVLLKDARIGEIAYNPADRSLLGIRHLNGLATLVRIPYPYDGWNQVHTFPYGVVPYDLDISPDGSLLSASISQVNGDQFLRIWEIEHVLAGDITHKSQFDFGQAVPEGFVFSPDGRYVYGSSYYTGVSNIFRFDVQTGDMAAVSNAETGFVRPIPMSDGGLLVYSYTGEGFTPVKIDPQPLEHLGSITFLGTEVTRRHPVVTTWQVPPPSAVRADDLITGTGTYVPLRELGVQSAYPVLQGYKGKVGLGMHTNVADPLNIANIGITVAYTPNDGLDSSERTHVALSYQYLKWRAGLSWNRSDFYDIFGPTRRGRKGFAATLGYDHPIIYDSPRHLDLRTDIALYTNIDTLPDFQNIGVGFERLATFQTGLYFRETLASLGAVDAEKGYTWSLVGGASRVGGEVVPRIRGQFDFGFPVPLRHSSLWFRSAVGAADGDRNDPFANQFFGGFGNNYVDNGSIKRYREHHSFPGFEINELGGRNYARHTVELNLPPYVFENVGTPGAYLTWLRPALFASALSTDPDSANRRRNFGSIGAQVDLRFTINHWFDMTLSAGYAQGYRGRDRADDEWMVSLKIL